MTVTARAYGRYITGIRACARLRPLSLSYAAMAQWSRFASPRKLEQALVIEQMQSCESCLKVSPRQAWDDYLWHAGANSLHTYLYGGMSAAWLGKTVTLVGDAHLKAAHALRRGVLLLTAHQHSMMLLAVSLGLLGLRTHPILMNPALTVPDFLSDYASRAVRDSSALFNGGSYLYVDYNQSFVRPVYRMLHEGHVVLSANDFPASLAPKRRLMIPFLGREISCPTGSVDIAINSGAAIVPAFIIRRAGRIVVEFHAPLGGGVEDVMAGYGQLLESAVSDDPGAWEGWKWPDLFKTGRPQL